MYNSCCFLQRKSLMLWEWKPAWLQEGFSNGPLPLPHPITVDKWQCNSVIFANCSHQSPTTWMDLIWGSFCPNSMFYAQFYPWFAEWLWPPLVFLISFCRWRKALLWSTNVCKCYDRMIYKLSASWGKETWGEQRKESRKTSKSRRNIMGLGKHFSPAALHYCLCACFTTTFPSNNKGDLSSSTASN